MREIRKEIVAARMAKEDHVLEEEERGVDDVKARERQKKVIKVRDKKEFREPSDRKGEKKKG